MANTSSPRTWPLTDMRVGETVIISHKHPKRARGYVHFRAFQLGYKFRTKLGTHALTVTRIK